MQDALFGTEVEFGVTGAVDAPLAAAMVKTEIFDGYRYGVVDPAPREWGETPANGGFLFNGGRLLVDSGHLEYATPECRTLASLVAQEMAVEQILGETVGRLGKDESIYFVKSNTDYCGNTFGYHESYSMRRRPDDDLVIAGLMPFLVTRQIFAGAGMVFFGGRNEVARYFISQRAQFADVEVSRRVRYGGRPIINLRDEPLGTRARLHVIIGDSNRSEHATALKIGTAALVTQLLDGGWTQPLALGAPVRDLRQIAANTDGDWTVQDERYGSVSAVEVQRLYLHEASRRFAGRDADTDWTLENWAQVLDQLESDPETLNGKLDWVTKRGVLREIAGESEDGWGDRDLLKVDQAYHIVGSEQSIFAALRERSEVGFLLPAPVARRAIASPPTDTRAFGRAQVLRALAEAGAADRVNWRRLRDGLSDYALWEGRLYRVYSYIDGWEEIDASGAWDVVPYVLDWESIAVNGSVLHIGDPFERYSEESAEFAGQVGQLLDEPPYDEVEFEEDDPDLVEDL